MRAVIADLAERRNPAAHTAAVTREEARRVRDAQLGVGMASALVELGRIHASNECMVIDVTFALFAAADASLA